MNVFRYDAPFLRSCDKEKDDGKDDDDDDEEEYVAWDFLSVGSVVAVAAHRNSQDVIWLIKIIESSCISKECETDSYGNSIVSGEHFLKGNFLERCHAEKDHTLFKLKKNGYIFLQRNNYLSVCAFERNKERI